MVDISELKISIVGLGLMGGSLSLALRDKVGSLTGFDQDAQTREFARRNGVVNAICHEIAETVATADLVVLAVPVRSILEILRVLPEIRPDGCMLLDLGSTKYEIERAMAFLPEQFAAVGGHPMCGRERSGIEVASETLYRDQTFILCRNQRTSEAMEGVALQVIHTVGAVPLFMSANTHDRLVAASSHLPYVVSAALMRRAWSVAQEDERLWQVSASGLRDTTRLAGSSPQMMLDILSTNRLEILRQLEAYLKDLSVLADRLREGDSDEIRLFLDEAYSQRQVYLGAKFISDI